MIAIHPDKGKNFSEFSKAYLRILDYNNIKYKILYIDEPGFWNQLENADYFIYRWLHTDEGLQKATTILPIIEDNFDIKCFPDKKIWWHYDDKIKQYYMMHVNGFPVVQTYVFWNEAAALNWLEKTEFPIIFKLHRGAGSQNVIKLETLKQAKSITKKMFRKGIISGRLPGYFLSDVREKGVSKSLKYAVKDILLKVNFPRVNKNRWIINKNYTFFQEFCKNNTYDTRVVTIGNRAFALQRTNRKNSFKASGSGLLNYNPSDIDINFIKIAFKVSKYFGFSTMAYDFLYDNKGKRVINEISYNFPHGDFLFDCPGYWNHKLEWNTGNKIPQFFQLEDFLEEYKLNVPPEYIKK